MAQTHSAVDGTQQALVVYFRSGNSKEIERVAKLLESLPLAYPVLVRTPPGCRTAASAAFGHEQDVTVLDDDCAATFSFLAAAEDLSDKAAANTIILRVDFGDDAPDKVRQRVLGAFLRKTIDENTIKNALKVFAEHPRLGLLLPADLPRSSIKGLGDAQTTARLGSVLNVAKEMLDDSYFIPHALYFARGSIVKALATKYLPSRTLRQSKNEIAAALNIGLMAACKSMGYEVGDLKMSGPKYGDVATVAANYTQQILSLPNKEDRHAEYRGEPRHQLQQDEHSPKLIAYYLPQFHPIPENDAWWGRGFTEWTNVSKAVPRFLGHYQPHLPGELGFYDLRLDGIQRRQVELARQHGIHGFCFYYYWFNGTKLLETPLRNFLEDRSLDFPFCLCWANENWTRTWDGQEREVLMEQSHAPRDDLQFIKGIRDYLLDPRYIRVQGKPLLLVYRASLLDDPKATAKRWRDYCRNSGIGEIYIAAVLSFDIEDATAFGFDAGVEFPPHRLCLPPPMNDSLQLADGKFEGTIYDYPQTVLLDALARTERKTAPSVPVLRGVMTSWDNDARRPGRGRIFHNATPSAYANWLRLALQATRQENDPDHQFVFVNAWNEWAEGAHLEPDRKFGYGYLNATADTIRLFDEAVVSSTMPTGLGSSSAAHRILPPHLLPRRSEQELRLYRERLDALPSKPTFRIVLAFDDLDPIVFDTLYSLAEQCYRNFELTVVTGDEFSPVWTQPRPAQVIRDGNLLAGINAAAEAATEDWLVLLAPGDRLLPHSLLATAEFVAFRPELQVAYTDELAYLSDPRESVPIFKPDFNLGLLRSTPYLGGLLLVARSAFIEAGGMSAGTEGYEEYDLALRILDDRGARAIGHIPEVLAWRRLDGRLGAARPKNVLHNGERQALANHAKRNRLAAEVADGALDGSFRFRCLQPHNRSVSIVIPTRDQVAVLQRCIESLLTNTAYTPFELLVIDNDSKSPETLAFLDGLANVAPERIRILRHRGDFNFSAINNFAAKEANGDYLLFLNNDTAALQPDWLNVMMEHAHEPDVGVVGCRLIFPSGNVQHAGITLGLNGVGDFALSGAPIDAPGPFGWLQLDRDVAAVTGACLLIRRSVFEEVGGMDERELPVAYGDFDLCLKVRQAGYRVVWTPHATLMHAPGTTLKLALSDAQAAARESARFLAEQEAFYLRWRPQVAHDPAFNPNLSLSSRNFGIETRPELARDPITWHPLNVAALPGDLHGSGHYRVIDPTRNAHDAGLTRSRVLHGYPEPVVFERLDIDTLFTQRQVDDAQIAAIERIKRLTDCRIVMDFDDLLTDVPDYSLHKKDVWQDMPARLERLCRSVDRVTVSTAPLAERMRRYHHDVRVVPNGLDAAQWTGLVSERRRSDKPRVGWVGGSGHAGDLALLREVVKQLADEVEWVFMGLYLEDMKPHLTEIHAGVPFAQYPRKMAALGLDLALAPLQANAFNECKSNLRILEYGVLGIPVIASDVEPYRGDFPIQRVGDRPQEWIAAIREHLADADAMERRGQQLRAKVLADWTLDRHIGEWLRAWSQ